MTCGRNSRISFTSAPGGLVHVLQGEAALGQRRQRVALGQPRVDEAEPLLLDAEDLAGLVHLLLPDLVDVLLDVRVALELGVEDRAALASGAGHHQHVHPLGHILGHGGRALARLVVGVGVDGHQSQLLSQDWNPSSLRSVRPVRRARTPSNGRGDAFYSDGVGGRIIPRSPNGRNDHDGRAAGQGAFPARGTLRARRRRDARADRKLQDRRDRAGRAGGGGVGWFGYHYVAGGRISAQVVAFKAVSDRSRGDPPRGPQGRDPGRGLHGAVRRTPTTTRSGASPFGWLNTPSRSTRWSPSGRPRAARPANSRRLHSADGLSGAAAPGTDAATSRPRPWQRNRRGGELTCGDAIPVPLSTRPRPRPVIVRLVVSSRRPVAMQLFTGPTPVLRRGDDRPADRSSQAAAEQVRGESDGQAHGTTVPTRSTCDPDQRQRHLAHPGGVRPAQGRAGAPVWSRAHRDRRQDRGSPPGRRPQGERRLPRGA